jgi:hypothetical protein
MLNSDKMIPPKVILVGILSFSVIYLAFHLGTIASKWQHPAPTGIILTPFIHQKTDSSIGQSKSEIKGSNRIENRLSLVKKEIKTLQSRAKKIEQELERPHIKKTKKLKKYLNAKLSQIL